MELIYLWVKDYKNIYKQGFNFSPQFQCEFNSGQLTINKKDDRISNFFGENINVTAVVGKNGSGKSNLLELIAYGKPTSDIPEKPKNFKELFEYYDLVVCYDEIKCKFKLYGMKPYEENIVQSVDDSELPLQIRLQACDAYDTYLDILTIYYSSSQDSIRSDNLPIYKKDISEYFLFEKIAAEIRGNNPIAVPFFTLWFINDSNNVQKSVELLKSKVTLPKDFIRPDKLKIHIDQNYVRTLYYKKVKDYFKVDETGDDIP